MITASSIIFSFVSMMVEETNDEAEARILAEAQAYVASLSDDEFEAWVVSMEKMGRFLEIAKIMRIEWLIARLESFLDSSLLLPAESDRLIVMDIRDEEITSVNVSKIISKYKNLILGYSNCIGLFLLPIVDIKACHFSDRTRIELCWKFSIVIDICKPHDDTRKICLLNCDYARYYAEFIDKCPRDDTRKAACGSPSSAYDYARVIDKRPYLMTRNATIGSTYVGYYDTNFLNPPGHVVEAGIKGWYKRYVPDVYREWFGDGGGLNW